MTLLKMTRLELRKAFCSRYFIVSLVLMVIVALTSAVYMINNNVSYNPHIIEQYAIHGGEFVTNPDIPLFGFYHSWIGGESISLTYTLFFALIPVASAIPFAWSYNSEYKSGYIKNVAVRTIKTTYYVAKGIAIFASGAAVVLIPLIINILVVSSFIPVYEPWVSYEIYNHIRFGEMWADIYYTMPALYNFLYVCLCAIYAGLFALVSYALSFYLKNRFAILFVPFLLMLALSYIEGVISSQVGWWYVEVVPTQFLQAASLMRRTSGIIVAVIAVIMIIFSVFTILVKGSRHEVL